MPNYDVFISFSTADRKTVEGICGYLERYGYRCFVSYRDIPPAVSWPSFISSAIKDSSLMVAVFSKDFNVSNETERELTIASKNNIPILTFKVSDTVMSDSKEYFLANLNWIDAFPNPENYFGKLKESIEKLIGKPKRDYLVDEEIHKRQEVKKKQQEGEDLDRLRSALLGGQVVKIKTPQPPVPKRREWVKRYIWVIAILLLLVALAVMLIKGGKSTPEPVVPVDTFKVNGVEFKMVKVEGGTFEMGATREQGNDAYGGEKPVHKVTLSDYYIGETVVTQELWKAVMKKEPTWNGGWTDEYGRGAEYPAYRVSYDEIVNVFIPELKKKLKEKTGKDYDFRLPTEAEWEYAARGGKKSRGYKYSGSKNLNEVAWYGDNSGGKTHPVKGKKANELGLYDMSGNVREWCNDWYGDYRAEAQYNPQGPKSGSNRVARGGSWYTSARGCRVSYRDYIIIPSYRGYNLGFRVVLAK